ncbi:MAG: DUF1207 domain-containing protein [Parachlamydiales bacterium]|jgi:hypothetical protein
MRLKFLALLACMAFSVFASSQEEYEKGKLAGLSRSDNLPNEALKGASDSYFEGYIQALLDIHYYEYQVVVIVKEHKVWLANLSKNELIAQSIVAFVKDIPGVEEVQVLNGVPPKELVKREKYVERPQVRGIWFPQTTELYQPMIASPRCVTYSINYRAYDKVMGRKSVSISMGDDFPVFRWLDISRWRGDLQVGIEACMWAVFNLDPHPDLYGGTELVNTDFYVGIPLSFATNKWSFKGRVYHISSHVGDEFLENHPSFFRKNPSYEAVDFFMSFQAREHLRLYAGPGFILHSDNSFPMKKGYVEYGTEIRFLGYKFYYHRLYGNWVVAAHFRNWQYLKWDFDGTFLLGYEFSKLQGVGRKIRFLTTCHTGFSVEGQFSRQRTTYGQIGFSYGF